MFLHAVFMVINSVKETKTYMVRLTERFWESTTRCAEQHPI